WPLLLALVNRAIRAQVSDGLTVDAASADVLRELETHGPTSVDLSDAGDRTTAVDRTMRASTSRLADEERDRYFELAIFPEDVDIPIDVVARYWQATADLIGKPVRQLCEDLARLGLLSLRGT